MEETDGSTDGKTIWHWCSVVVLGLTRPAAKHCRENVQPAPARQADPSAPYTLSYSCSCFHSSSYYFLFLLPRVISSSTNDNISRNASDLVLTVWIVVSGWLIIDRRGIDAVCQPIPPVSVTVTFFYTLRVRYVDKPRRLPSNDRLIVGK